MWSNWVTDGSVCVICRWQAGSMLMWLWYYVGSWTCTWVNGYYSTTWHLLLTISFTGSYCQGSYQTTDLEYDWTVLETETGVVESAAIHTDESWIQLSQLVNNLDEKSLHSWAVRKTSGSSHSKCYDSSSYFCSDCHSAQLSKILEKQF